MSPSEVLSKGSCGCASVLQAARPSPILAVHWSPRQNAFFARHRFLVLPSKPFLTVLQTKESSGLPKPSPPKMGPFPQIPAADPRERKTRLQALSASDLERRLADSEAASRRVDPTRLGRISTGHGPLVCLCCLFVCKKKQKKRGPPKMLVFWWVFLSHQKSDSPKKDKPNVRKSSGCDVDHSLDDDLRVYVGVCVWVCACLRACFALSFAA